MPSSSFKSQSRNTLFSNSRKNKQRFRGPLHETRHETRAGMSFHVSTSFISGADLSSVVFT